MSFRLKLTVTTALLIAIAFGTGGTILISTSFSSVLKEEKKAAIHAYENVRNTLELIGTFSDTVNNENMADALKQMEAQGSIDLQVLLLRASDKELFVKGDRNLITENLPVPDGGSCSSAVIHDKNGYGFLILGTVQSGDRHLILEARYDLTSAYETREVQQNIYLIIYSVVIVLGIAVSIIISFILTKQLRRLTNTARKIAGGDLSQRSDIRSQDEFGQLSADFDAMADRLQENISRLKEDVERQESFMGAFAHELKTPMTSIIGYADLLRQEGLEDSDRRAAADYIYSEGKRLEKLSFKLLDLLLMEKDELVLKQVSLSSLFKYVTKAMAPVAAKRKVRLVCRCGKGKAYMEPDLIRSLIFNLIDNALKAIEDKGTVLIEGKLIPGGFRIKVTDSGRGMAKEETVKITEAFYRVDKSRSRKQGGAGLGLALCKRIVELHRGTISFFSEIGKGTCVTVELFTDSMTDIKEAESNN